MSDVKHTDGPWRCNVDKRGYALGVIAPQHAKRPGGIVSVVRDRGIGLPSSEEGKANMRLIAAAPDLLAALKSMISISDRMRNDGAHQDEVASSEKRARAAISRAEGGRS